jgi:LPS-assembly protein
MADMRRLLLWLVVLVGLSQPGFAQDKATLVADSLRIAGDQVLIAEGHVEIFFKGSRLQAASVT